MRNECFFSNPDVFDPNRFLGALQGNEVNISVHPLNIYSAANPSSMVFGFGRRFVIVINDNKSSSYSTMLPSLLPESALVDSSLMRAHGS